MIDLPSLALIEELRSFTLRNAKEIEEMESILAMSPEPDELVIKLQKGTEHLRNVNQMRDHLVFQARNAIYGKDNEAAAVLLNKISDCTVLIEKIKTTMKQIIIQQDMEIEDE